MRVLGLITAIIVLLVVGVAILLQRGVTPIERDPANEFRSRVWRDYDVRLYRDDDNILLISYTDSTPDDSMIHLVCRIQSLELDRDSYELTAYQGQLWILSVSATQRDIDRFDCDTDTLDDHFEFVERQ